MNNPFTTHATNDSTWRASDSRTSVSDHLTFPSQVGHDTGLYFRATRTGTDSSSSASLPALELYNAGAIAEKNATTDFSPSHHHSSISDFTRAALELGMADPGPIGEVSPPKPIQPETSSHSYYNEFGGVNIPATTSGLGADDYDE